MLVTAERSLDDLSAALVRLDGQLSAAVQAAAAAYGTQGPGDRYRGLYVSHEDALHLLQREPGAPLLAPPPAAAIEQSASDADVSASSPWGWLASAFDLSAFDLDIVLLALAPHVDLKYERLYGYLQDDVTRRHPTLDLALNLLCASKGERIARRAHLAPGAPLVRHRLLQLLPDPNQFQPPLLAHYLRLDDQIVNVLLGQQALDPRLASCAERVTPALTLAETGLPAAMKAALATLAAHTSPHEMPLRLYFRGTRASEQRGVAEAIAAERHVPLIAADVARALASDVDFGVSLTLLFREAWLQGAVLYLEGLDALKGEDRHVYYRQFVAAVNESATFTILAGVRPWVAFEVRPLGVVEVVFKTPAFAERRQCWESRLTAAGVHLDDERIGALADRFRLTPWQIADAVATAHNRAAWRVDPDNAPDPDAIASDLFAAARLQTGSELDALARRVDPRHDWDDIVLPDDARGQLQQVCARVRCRQRVLGDWGFARRLGSNSGVNALFAGPPGTGKTMAAEVLAQHLGLDLYKIDLSSVVSKYIGETEKNLERIFSAAESANVILFFDEADALFGKRSEVRDSHDRYANVEISYLLQRMEEYDGLAILASNLRQNMDEAFVRRLHFIVEFPFPDEADRRRIWQVHFPPELPRDPDIDVDSLARSFKLAGGSIRSVVLDAAFLAAGDGQSVGARHVLQATKREYQKMGKVAPELVGGERAARDDREQVGV